ncbi:beta-N-acetylhexosaminidase [Adhaeribacter pallidiroseus]|uniref:beta-N-acetylhexosaminidase n=1 Tax=Adhaeribacter pallidiroseus TaxID=2072847 RepID=A0A369QJL4_9BACT|nr:family 20 glycosylhydrolase [Adhaeribacter pallidiroseus]RDC64914.1 Beta-N-acetylhexosaminidase [Adhaeribacter pallidiroseus]
MKKMYLQLAFCLVALTSFGQTSASKTTPAIIPQPVSMTVDNGQFLLPKNVVIAASTHPELKQTVAFLKNRLATPTGRNVTVSQPSASATIRLILNQTTDNAIGKEGYRLTVTPKSILIRANQPAGLFYGAQSLVQLFPAEIESATLVKNVNWQIPCVTVMDHPRFGWRGLMFDVSRHFFTKNEVKQYIDDMVRYKYNLLHLHLTDDEGWRIEIKSLPKLTQVGAWSVKKVGYFGSFAPPTPEEPRTYGGFYTQADIKELVQYAKDRFVNILPEIDVPGHSLAAVVSYPELSCTPGVENYRVRSGEQIMDWSRGAPPIALVDNTLCPANEKVYEFLDKVITELAQLFPFEYIHVGGDETPQNFWEKNDAIKGLMKKENLKNMHEVQGYFERRLEKIVLAKGKKFMGWDEILEGGLAPSAAVMSWRGMKGGIQAARQKHDVVMSPTDFAYIDYMQGDPAIEPKVYASLRLNKAYQFEPLPDSVDPKYIKGGQANLWTEQVYNMRHAQYMTWPRGFAIAESLWSPKETKSWPDFVNRVENHFTRYEFAEKNYAPSVYEPIVNVTRTPDDYLRLELSTEVEGLDIYYTFDNSFPDRFYPKYLEPLVPPKDAAMLKLITYRGNKPVGRLITLPIKDLEQRAPKKK